MPLDRGLDGWPENEKKKVRKMSRIRQTISIAGVSVAQAFIALLLLLLIPSLDVMAQDAGGSVQKVRTDDHA